MIIPFKFTQDTAEELYYSTEKYPVEFEVAWKVLGYSRKDSAKRKLTSYFNQDTDYRLHSNVESAPDGGLTHREDIYLTVECFKEMGMLAKSEEGKQIRKYFLQCEAIAKEAVRAVPQLQQQIQNLQQSFELMQAQIQTLLPMPSDFIPPGWDAKTWDSLPSQDKQHFKYLYRHCSFHPGSEVEVKKLPAANRSLQRAEIEHLINDVPESEKELINAAKQLMLKRFWADGGESWSHQ
ncbi:MAG TPA: hypothetical protein VE944_29070 [Nostoc sp.]|uniref:hypothetical protein n=1 Tax=Nostoc sp. TaxID=1180 RepID=UPI002D2B4EB9|nr:hypothetical protein [Nostoc sp.]HYX18347.1 hypothetical protein [Nostoc sp.]